MSAFGRYVLGGHRQLRRIQTTAPTHQYRCHRLPSLWALTGSKPTNFNYVQAVSSSARCGALLAPAVSCLTFALPCGGVSSSRSRASVDICPHWHLPGPMPDSEHRSCPARRHTRRQRFYNLPELLEIVPVPGYSGMGLMSFHQGYLYLPRPHALRVVSMSCFSSLLIPVPLATTVTGGCGWIRTTVPRET